jgi:hypothetical protein
MLHRCREPCQIPSAAARRCPAAYGFFPFPNRLKLCVHILSGNGRLSKLNPGQIRTLKRHTKKIKYVPCPLRARAWTNVFCATTEEAGIAGKHPRAAPAEARPPQRVLSSFSFPYNDRDLFSTLPCFVDLSLALSKICRLKVKRPSLESKRQA